MDLPSAGPNLALILPLPSTSSVNLGQESHEGTEHCRCVQPLCVLGSWQLHKAFTGAMGELLSG